MTPVEGSDRGLGPDVQTCMPPDDRGGASRAPSGGGRGPRAQKRTAAITDSRIAAAAILADMRSGQLLDPAFERHAGPLDARDRRWVQELVWGTLRSRSWFDAVVGLRVRGGLARLDGDVADLLRSARISCCSWAACRRMPPSRRRWSWPSSGTASARASW
jgi:hypothetical protein